MIRDEYLRRLVDAAHVDLYLSAVDGARIYWPWRMQPVHEASERHRNACESYVVDSSFKDESITNEDALDMAYAMDAEMVVLADVWHEKDETVTAILEGIELYDDHSYEGKVIAPLQPPHDECYLELEGQVDVYAVGGVKDAGDETRIEAARCVRDVAGTDVHLHGLGYGATDAIVEAIRADPELLDSIDYSTPIQSANGTDVAPGKERMSVVAARAAAQLVEDLRKFSPYAEQPQPEDLRGEGQSGLDEVAVRTDGGDR
ncbi:hypothetical protein HTG_14245 [Natrinema mahii]|nr:hypothetical protein HTG_14245 [Natrinema mahii]